MRDELAVLRDLRPSATDPDPAVVDRERSALLEHIATAPAAAAPSTASTPSEAGSDAPELIEDPRRPARESHRSGRSGRSGRSRRRRVWRAGAAVGLVATAAAAGWAAVQRDPALTARIECLDLGSIDVRSGDPVADCADAWRAQHGAEPPPLVAYTDETGANVYVVDASQEPPDGWVALDPDFRQDVRLRELEDELADVGRGLSSGCFTQPEAIDLVTSQLRRLGLADWTVRTDAPGPGEPRSGPDVCATYAYFVDQEEPRVVVIRAIGQGEPDSLQQERQLARALYDRMVAGPGHRCMTLDEALAVAREEAERAGFEPTGPGIEFETIPAPSAPRPTCTRPTTWVGGLVHITLRETSPR